MSRIIILLVRRRGKALRRPCEGEGVVLLIGAMLGAIGVLAHSRRRVDKQHVDSVILYENPSQSVLMPIFHPQVFDHDNEVIHCHEVPSSPSR